MAKQRKKKQSIKTEDVFKVKNKASKKNKNIANKLKTKSVSSLKTHVRSCITCYVHINHVILCCRGKRYGRDMMYWMINLYSCIKSNHMICHIMRLEMQRSEVPIYTVF